MLPSLDNLRCFTAAARLLNFRTAARTVALTPAAFGQRIQKLEEQLGTPLFTRSTRRVALTPAGAALLPWAERCLAAAEDCTRAVHGEKGPPQTELFIGTRHELGLSWLLPYVDELERQRPWLRVHLTFGGGPDLLRDVRSMRIDCVITSARLVDPKLDSIQLHDERYVFCGAASLLKRLPLRRAADAKEHTLIDAAPELPLFRYWVDAPGGGNRLRFARVSLFGTIAAIRQRVAAEAGVAVLPEYFVRADIAEHRFMRVFPSVEPQHDWFRLVFRADDRRRPLFEDLAELLRAQPLR